MGKDGGQSLSDWHRQKRKKELQKTKTARIAARDEKVKTEKTVASVQEEIREVERHHKNVERRPHAVQSKLDRLKKELKMVKAEAEEAKKKAPAPAPINSAVANFKPMENPAISVYYDPVMNPFGEPPPGKPRLYHCRGGGVTMNMDHACVPGQDYVPPLPPPPPPRHGGDRGVRSTDQQQHASGTGSIYFKPTTSKPPPSPSLPKGPPPGRANKASSKSASLPPQKKPIDPSQIPALPKPSIAVQRSKKKAAADIWASQEEMEYEEAVGTTSLEGVAPAAASSQWWYQDQAGAVQGPFTTDKLVAWIQVGYFPLTTRVRSTPHSPWKPMAQVNIFHQQQKHTLQSSKPTEPAAAQSVKGRVAALNAERQRQEADDTPEPSVLDRIATLRKEREDPVPEDQDDPEACSVLDRIAALRKEREDPVPEDQDDPEACSVLDRIAALRKKREDPVPEDQDDPEACSVLDRITALRKEREDPVPEDQDDPVASAVVDDKDAADSVLNRIAALRAAREMEHKVDNENHIDAGAIESSLSPPLPPPPPLGQHGLPPPPPFPASSQGDMVLVYSSNDHIPAAYPLNDDDEGVAPYPVDTENMPAYAMDDSDWQAEELTVVDAYPEADNYDEFPRSPTNEGVSRPVVDPEVVAFLPSHLQKRKETKHMAPTMNKKRRVVDAPTPQTTPTAKASEDNDYDRFLNEVDQL